MIRTILTFALILSVSAVVYSQTPDISNPVLTKTDVKHFVDHFPEIQKEFESANIDFNANEDIESLMDAFDGMDEINSIVKSHGYSDYSDFALKSWAIASCYASIKIEKEGMPNIQSAIDEIQANESLTAEQKELSILQLKQVFETLSTSVNENSNSQDIETVRAYLGELDSIFE